MSGKVVLSFVLGAATGAVGMYFGMKQACEVYIDKEIEQFKADYEATHKEKPEEKSKDLKEMNENLEKDHLPGACPGAFALVLRLRRRRQKQSHAECAQLGRLHRPRSAAPV